LVEKAVKQPQAKLDVAEVAAFSGVHTEKVSGSRSLLWISMDINSDYDRSLNIYKQLGLYVSVVFSIKFIVFVLDPIPKFFFGDSECYISSALLDWIPPDRSFTYGYLIRLTAVQTGSITSLVAIQIFTSALSAVLLTHGLKKYFSVTPAVAYAMGILCAVEPIQLLYERYVMTETISLFLFVLYILSAFHYLQKPSLRILCLVQTIGIALISLRVSFLPIILLNTGLLPLLVAVTLLEQHGKVWLSFKFSRNHSIPRSKTVPAAGLHLLLSVSLVIVLHTGYKQLFATLSHHPAGYNAASGYFLVSLWAPAVEPADFPSSELGTTVFGNLRYDLKDRMTRADQLFSDGGLVSRIEAAIPGPDGNRAALTTAINALKRDPQSIAALAIKTFLDYFDMAIIRSRIMNDLAIDQLTEYELFAEKYAQHFFFPGKGLQQPFTLTKKYYQHAIAWYWFLLFAPLVSAGALFSANRRDRSLLIELFLIIVSCLATISVFTVSPVVRYLHPVSWLVFFTLGILCHKTLMRLRTFQIAEPKTVS
jgi:hypothetical protein